MARKKKPKIAGLNQIEFGDYRDGTGDTEYVHFLGFSNGTVEVQLFDDGELPQPEFETGPAPYIEWRLDWITNLNVARKILKKRDIWVNPTWSGWTHFTVEMRIEEMLVETTNH